jgi:hypothetical protein
MSPCCALCARGSCAYGFRVWGGALAGAGQDNGITVGKLREKGKPAAYCWRIPGGMIGLKRLIRSLFKEVWTPDMSLLFTSG